MKKILIIICSILILIVFLVSCGNSNFSSIQSCIFYEAGVDDCSTLVSSNNKYGIKEIVEDAKKYEYPDSKENSGLVLDDSDNVSTFVLFYAVVSLNKFDIYVMIDSIPNDVYEAAEVEGAGFFTIYWRVFLPLVRPAILAQVIFWFLGIWNDFLAPDLYLPTTENKTLQVMIRWFNQDAGGGGSLVNQPLVMAASVLSSIPTLTIYMIFQKYFVNTFMLSGVKR